MARTTSRRAALTPGLRPRIKVWLEIDGEYAFGHGLCEMLQAIDRAGSIKQAASDLGKSYRYVWGRIKEAEGTLGRQLVESHVGGTGVQRSLLTTPARRLVADYLALRERMRETMNREFARRFGQ